jgi:cytochrome c-type biogenesis protein CcsB
METSSFGSASFFTISLFVYLISTVLYILYAALKNEQVGKVATGILTAGIAINTIALILRAIEVKHAPFVTTYESLSFWAWLIALVYLIFQFKLRIRVLGALVTPIAFLAIAAASVLPPQYKQANPLVPALQSHWLEFHITTAFIGYACFAVSFAVSLAYLLKHTDNEKSLITKDKLDSIAYKAVSIGFPFLTIGIMSGAIWANMAWGRYWGWDPKEVWSLITWFIYAIYLHLRIVAKWKGNPAAYTAIIGFAAVIFTFFGVSFILSGLHSYG